MPEPLQESTGTIALAFDILLHKMGALEAAQRDLQHALQQMLPLLTKIVGLLEARDVPAGAPVAAWDQLYPEVRDERPAPPEPLAGAPAGAAQKRRPWQWWRGTPDDRP